MQFILPYIERLPGIPDSYNMLVAQILSALVFLLLLALCAKVATWVSNRVFPKLISKLHAEKWAEAFLEHKFFTAVGVVAAAIVAINWHSVFISENIAWFANFMGKLTGLFVILSFSWLFNTFLNTINHLYGRNPSIPLKGLVQALKIVLFLGAGLFVLSLLLGRKPMYIITGLSALAAVFSLIFKDPILGFAASIQLTTNKLIKIGDWITVDSAGADGDIVDISLTCVRVQNFDKTIVSVPTYDLISKPFKNWSGMYEAKARRIQRSILLDIDTVRFLDKETFERLKKIDLLKDYLAEKEAEIKAFNAERNVKENILNGRHLTNVGTFRKYAELYLASRPYVVSNNPNFTLMVRQLKQNPQGLPLEVYCFLNTTVWLDYERLQSDIFDHLFSVLPEFGLYAYQQPSGRNVAEGVKELLKK
ncbi:MAG: mechanosensitive ion channel family protein [Elusimicrobium sp.]|uniref:Mechanosensitive ion channel family protein n=1 Tax=Candidatus Avelusimicrobium gallicola TaxID=2562704 RepID=A0A928HGD1_9BACT|nr:mechanosensitive ion channel family protein [Elusimicrobium sp.]